MHKKIIEKVEAKFKYQNEKISVNDLIIKINKNFNDNFVIVKKEPDVVILTFKYELFDCYFRLNIFPIGITTHYRMYFRYTDNFLTDCDNGYCMTYITNGVIDRLFEKVFKKKSP